ncbi:NAD(P)H-dependent oxidoreductase [Xanthomonas arboricola]|uniref:NAD(P)H-dependent oxidoreductase n=1 Tax=Xanthomonas arboricola TaxID=56448 RepID=UPI001622ADBB|nr:NAD(P)H-dependent oxidoreductase [Xanthomonas arboricola]MBB4596462.1 modulator of drug activity B [Xanthomonas arboricola]
MSMPPIQNIDTDDSIAGHERREFIRAGLMVTAAAMLPAVVSAASGSTTGAGGARAARKVLVINAHQNYPGISEGRLNRTLVGVIKEELENKGYDVRQTSIEEGYTVNEEVQKHLWADIIITQSPVFWFGAPWIYKKYIDEVFTAGMVQQSFISGDGRTADDPARQYGTGGKLQGKQFLLSLTMNAPKEVFDDRSQKLHEGRSLDDLFWATTWVYKFCGIAILPTFGAFDVMRAPQIQRDTDRLKQRLVSL